MKILPVGSQLFRAEGRADRQTDRQSYMAKLIVAYRNFATALKNRIEEKPKEVTNKIRWNHFYVLGSCVDEEMNR
jgi:hypothetical protein